MVVVMMMMMMMNGLAMVVWNKGMMGMGMMLFVVGDVVLVVVVPFPSWLVSFAIQTKSLFHFHEKNDHFGVVVHLVGGIPRRHGHLGQWQKRWHLWRSIEKPYGTGRG